MAEPERWYVLRVRFGFETLVGSELRKHKINVFLPLRYRTEWMSREIGTMAFPGHIFARFSLDERHSVLMVPGVLCVAGAPEPVPIGEDQILNLQAAIRAGLPPRVFPFDREQHEGRVVEGPLCGRKGSFIEHNGEWHFAVRVAAIERTLAFPLPGLSVEISCNSRTIG